MFKDTKLNVTLTGLIFEFSEQLYFLSLVPSLISDHGRVTVKCMQQRENGLAPSSFMRLSYYYFFHHFISVYGFGTDAPGTAGYTYLANPESRKSIPVITSIVDFLQSAPSQLIYFHRFFSVSGTNELALYCILLTLSL